MPNIVHLIPYQAIGGVERAAQSMSGVVPESFSFSVATIFPQDISVSGCALWKSFFYFSTLWRLWRSRPEVLVVSLWRAYAVGALLKVLRPSTRLVVFLHFPNDVHLPDFLLTRLAARLATCVWADGHQTLLLRLPCRITAKTRVISFVTERCAPLSLKTALQPTFIFWGRIHPQKRLARAVRLFAAVRARRSDARFIVIGPDGGDLLKVQRQVIDLGLADAVDFRGGMEFKDICREAEMAAFYLQTSELEGMAMSVVEAMQLGLVPVVTPVGEIANYARAGENAVLVTDDARAVDELLSLLDDLPRYLKLRAQAIATWQRVPLYKDDVLRACQEVLTGYAV